MAKKAARTPLTGPPANRLLARLPPEEYQKLLPCLRPVSLESNQVLHEAHKPIKYAYFPTRAVASYLTVMKDGAAIEVGTVGNEGAVGTSMVLGLPPVSPHRVIVQVPGEGLRMAVAELVEQAGESEALRRLLALSHAAFSAQVSQSVACNGLHTVDRRCCRWLLMTHDRVGAEVLPLTHEFLGLMLGVRRASVTTVLGPLRDRGLIRYARGAITVLDRAGLEAAACECYRDITDEYERLFG